MNVIFISPQFPENYWHFCEALRRNGANVFGIGDTPYDNISRELKDSVTEYYWVPSLNDYEQVFKAVAYLSWKYGKMDWLESNNEYWLDQDARLREDFNITTGANIEQMSRWRSKAEMKRLYADARVASARQIRVSTLRKAQAFAREVGYPLFAKPEFGVGTAGSAKIADAKELREFFSRDLSEPYVLEQFVSGSLCSYEAILDSKGTPLFENQCEFPPSMFDVVSQQLDISYYARPTVEPKLRSLGRSVAKTFGLTSRFVHMEFFRLDREMGSLGSVGDYVGLEVNVRPPGGYTPDMLNYAHSTNVYQIWADMVCFDESRTSEGDRYTACYVGRRDCHAYAHSEQEIRERFSNELMMTGRIPDALSNDLCNQMYLARFSTAKQRQTFERFVMEQV